MNLKDYVAARLERENQALPNAKLRFFAPKSSQEIVKLYQTYAGSTSQMHPLNQATVNEYLDRGFAFAGAYYDQDLVGIAVSKQFPENYPYFALPQDEEKGAVYTLGGLYVRPDFQGLGIASKLSRIIVQGTEKFGQETGEAVGIGYEVSYNNEKSLKTLCKQGHYIGYYNDKKGKEGLSILLYRPFNHQALKIQRPTIELNHDEETSWRNLEQGLTYIGNQPGVGGTTKTIKTLADGNEVMTHVVNRTANTIAEPTFDYVR